VWADAAYRSGKNLALLLPLARSDTFFSVPMDLRALVLPNPQGFGASGPEQL
jgi:hypothetical protein